MSLSWNEIRTRASRFVTLWKPIADSAREEADAQTFENGFFEIFGVTRSQIAIFEHRVRLNDGSNGYIDLFWKSHILVEMKTPGKDMSKAYSQAKEYANALAPNDLPKGILICDFRHFDYYNLLEEGRCYSFNLDSLVDNIELFSDLAGYKDVEFKKQDSVNIEAAEKMGALHDRLKEIGYTGHQLELYLVRLLFCLFADDTGIFDHDHFIRYIIQRTNADGSDLAMHIQKIFETLNIPKNSRLKTIDSQLNAFPYVNGGLFMESLQTADFDSQMRETLIECCALDWSKISPAIFGSIFQSVMNEVERRSLGAHYTSEENILKVVHPLFLDDLWSEFDKTRKLVSDVRIERLNQFHEKLAALRFLDPACGCGNFLVITYRELRILEFDVIKELLGGERILDVDTYVKVNVNQFYGMEIEEFPSQIAQVAMWLMDHQMNMLVREMFGEYYVRIPLRESATIVCGNALSLDWNSVIPKTSLSYILGNPPFIGAMLMTEEQRGELSAIFGAEAKGVGEIDYVAAWYKKAAIFIDQTKIECAFVSTNSICQGQQVATIWEGLFYREHICINFAHQTFKWFNEARGKAAVYCVIVGFSQVDRKEKKLYHYASVTSEPVEISAKQINAYLLEAPTVFIHNRSTPLFKVPPMNYGNMPRDGGGLVLTEEERAQIIALEPLAEKWIRLYLGADEYIYNKKRYCLWLVGASPSELRLCPMVLKRIEAVRAFRIASKAKSTREFAKTPSLFCQITQPADQDYIIIPLHSSEKRKYIPIGFMSGQTISSNANSIIVGASLYHFGILTSTMHMAWVAYVGGRLELRYRYSKDIVYNNFPWPQPNPKQIADIEANAASVLAARGEFPEATLADLYDPATMPPALVRAHDQLDKSVERAYGKQFSDDSVRVAFLLDIYMKSTADLFSEKVSRRKA